MDKMLYNDTINDTSLEALETLNDKIFATYLPAIVYTAVLMMVGTPGNIIVIYIYHFKWRRCTSRMFIIYLAVLDLINCISTLPMEIYIMRYSIMFDIPVVCKLSRCLTYTMNSASALILVGIAVDRFKRICKPYTQAISVVNSNNICIGSVFISVCITWPALVLYGTRKIHVGEIAGTSCLIENRYDSTPFPNTYFIFMGSMTVVIFTTLSVLYYFVGLQIYKRRDFKKKRCSRVEMIIEEKSTEKSMNGIVNGGISSNDSNKDGDNNYTEIRDVVHQESLSNGTNHQTSETCEEPNVGVDIEFTLKDNEQRTPHNSSNELTFVKDISGTGFKNVIPQAACSEEHSKDVNAIKNTPHNNIRNSAKRARVKYILVRGSTTHNSSGRTKCSDYLTIRIGKSTFMLFLITVIYIVSFLPFYILAITRQSNASFLHQMSRASLMTYQVFLRSYLLSSAINPIIYCFCNAQFRGNLVNIFKSLFTRKYSLSTERKCNEVK